MKKKLIDVLLGIMVVGIIVVLVSAKIVFQNEVVVIKLNESASHYQELNENDLRVEELQELLTTYAPTLSLLDASKKEFKYRPDEAQEFFKKKELKQSISDFRYVLIYNYEEDAYFSVELKKEKKYDIPAFTKVKQLFL
ncbi:MAG: hypothetical protein HFI75_02955 [Lachnospiraceae bacterium]|nr:hypothetical protein [Lachnospiraceae bacterium]